ncbi:MAG: serpin family protein [Bacteroidales bacterium]|nr:serpin family protein [Bacteroidales bacterium]
MKAKLLPLIISLLIAFTACKKESTTPIHNPKTLNLPVEANEIISKSNNFGIDLFKKTASVEEGNIMLSPLSASAALTMLLNGCSSSTYNQIQQMLGFEEMNTTDINETYKSLVDQLLNADPDVKLAIANAIWYRQGFDVKPPFLNTMQNDFSAHIEGLDFSQQSALTTMNKWASDNTFGKIPKVLDEISPDAVMFLMNALYFKGTWTYQFDKSKTYSENFYKEDNSTVSVSMMHAKFKANVYTNANYKAIELNYGRTNFSMIVIVPNETLADLFNNFSNEDWNNLTTSFNSNISTTQWDISFPKFQFSYEKVLNDQLKSMGMVDAFDSDLADLSGIFDAKLYVNFVKQNTFIDVNEEGTEAAAVTTIGVNTTSAGDSNEFIVNKPFAFAIRERTTNTILFIGKVVNPLD